jgi:hypothetical protein
MTWIAQPECGGWRIFDGLPRNIRLFSSNEPHPYLFGTARARSGSQEYFILFFPDGPFGGVGSLWECYTFFYVEPNIASAMKPLAVFSARGFI